MYKKLRVSVVLPCREESGHLKEVISRIPKFVDEIIVVSNKSDDNTVAVAKKLGAKAFEDNRTVGGIGYGYAIMTGLDKAIGDLVMKIDGDATYPVEELDKVIDYMQAKKLDFLSCSRYPLQAGSKIPFILRFGVWLLNMEVRILYGLRINDILSGMWIVKRKFIPQLDLSEGDWNLSPQVKLNAARHPKIKFGEFSIAQLQRMGKSHQNYFKTGYLHARFIFVNRFKKRRYV